MKIAAVQLDTSWEMPEENFAALGPEIERAARLGARVVLMPEMFATGFSMATEKIAEPPGGPSESFLLDAARRNGVFVGGSCPVAPPGAIRPYNRFVLASPDGATAHYDKIHPFGFGGESQYYAPGEEGLTVAVDDLRCTLFVCYDLRFADRFWTAAPHTDCYFVVANWPAARKDHWRTLCKARAIENLAYVVAVNRVGVGDGIVYEGGSIIVDPFGEIVAEADAAPQLLVGEVDRARVESVRSRYPFLEDR